MATDPLPRRAVVSSVLVVALVACIAGAVGTAIWTLRHGLLSERPPLPAWHTAIRVVIVLAAGLLAAVRRDRTERVALVCAVVAAGSSTLFGLGIRAPALFATRLIFHFLAYAIGSVAIGRLLLRAQSQRT
jgi:CHASE2 domain-containing sensor protein